jgi:hypothetical protein
LNVFGSSYSYPLFRDVLNFLTGIVAVWFPGKGRGSDLAREVIVVREVGVILPPEEWIQVYARAPCGVEGEYEFAVFSPCSARVGKFETVGFGVVYYSHVEQVVGRSQGLFPRGIPFKGDRVALPREADTRGG